MIRVKVPATSANLGPGFDTIGIALEIFNTFSVEIIDIGLKIEGCEEKYINDNNLVYRSIKYIFDKRNKKMPGLKLTIESKIPESSGTGSSATCIVGGLILGNELLERPYDREDLFKFAVEIEGHGDNVAPAIFGGLTITMIENNNHYVKNIEINNKFKFALLVSDQKKESTNKLRQVLKESVLLRDCVYNISHSMMMLEAFKSGDSKLLSVSMKDRIHEFYRAQYIDNYLNICEFSKICGSISINVSGAGPSILLTYDNKFDILGFKHYIKTLDYNWKIHTCNVCDKGAFIIKGDD